jgi:phenylacetate-CoA ligase
MIGALGWNAYLAFHIWRQRNIPFLPPDEFRRLQSRRVRRMVRYAWQHVPYYRDAMSRLGIQPDRIQCAEDLSRLPLIDRDDLRRDPQAFVSRTVNRSACLELLSSGSCGTPTNIWHDPASLFQNAAHGERERPVMTRALGSWTAYREMVIVSPIGASQAEIQDFVRKRGFFPRRLRRERQYILLSDPPEKNLDLINDFRPDLLYSYGSYLDLLFRYIRRTGASWHRPKGILYSSDNLSDATRAWITGDCGIPVFTVYGSVEALKIGFGCEEGRGYHVNSDLYPLRIIDSRGRDAEPGQPGEVVLSNLVNRATVLLNYRLGDLASTIPEPCPCGRTLPLISAPTGREDQIMELPDGSEVHPIFFHGVCLGVPGIVQYQVRQTQPAALRVSLVVAPGADTQAVERHIRNGLQERFGSSVTAEVRFVNEIERTKGGKTLAVVSLRQGDPC